MDIYHRDLPGRCRLLWFVPDGESLYREEGYVLTAVLHDLGGGVCEAVGAIGDLDQETIIKVGLSAIEAGYRVLQCQVLKGKTVSRFLTLVGSDETFNYYTVDLLATAERLGIEGIE